jgi:hypothetical protein
VEHKENTVAQETEATTTETTPEVDPTEALVKSFAFVNTSAIPKRSSEDRLATYRAENAEKRKAAGAAAAKGLLAGKALTDNVSYPKQIDATRVASRAKALVGPALVESGKRASVTTTGSDKDGWKWFVVSKDLPKD